MKRIKQRSWRHVKSYFWLGIIFVFLIQCTSSTKKNSKEVLLPIINYHLISTADTSEWLKSLSGDTLQAILVLNRIDKNSLLNLDSLVFPDTIGRGIKIYTPFPTYVEGIDTVHKILFVSYYAQAFAVYEKGVLKRWGPANLGKESTPTPTGLLSTNWKAKRTISTVDSTWIMDWYFNLENLQGASMHQYEMIGLPASHACVRLYEKDAYWLYNWADQWVLKNGEVAVYGTPVIIFGTYPFDGRKPWMRLAKNKDALKITPSELMKETKKFLPTILERQEKRDSL